MKRWFLLAIALAACRGGSEAAKTGGDTSAPATASSGGPVDLTGAGATFPYPIYDKWIHEYATKTGVRINYQSIGSGGGIRMLSEQTVDFGASDAPMSDSEIASAKGGPVLHVPTVIGVVAISYNLPQLTQPLKLTGGLVAALFLGTITKWNDSRIAAVNPGASLPATDILVVHRTESSGTTYVFSDYLSSVSKAWKAAPGKGKALQWPVGLGGKANEADAGQLKQTPGAIGYVELAYANQNHLSTAMLQNADGQFVAPSAAGATEAAAATVNSLPPNTDYRVSIVNAKGATTYPIASFTWLLVYQHPADPAKAKKLANFIRWALTDGAAEAAALDYAPLPAGLVSRLTARVDSSAAGAPR